MPDAELKAAAEVANDKGGIIVKQLITLIQRIFLKLSSGSSTLRLLFV